MNDATRLDMLTTEATRQREARAWTERRRRLIEAVGRLGLRFAA